MMEVYLAAHQPEVAAITCYPGFRVLGIEIAGPVGGGSEWKRFSGALKSLTMQGIRAAMPFAEVYSGRA